MKPLLSQLGSRLRELRRRHFRSQRAFANKCRSLGIPITRDKMANCELGRAEMPASLVPLMTCVMEVSVTDLLPDLTRHAIVQLVGRRVLHDTQIEEGCHCSAAEFISRATRRELRLRQRVGKRTSVHNTFKLE